MAPAHSIISPTSFDVTKVKFGVPKNLDNGGKIIPVYYDEGQFVVQTPKLSAPYGVNRWDNASNGGGGGGGGGVKLSLDVSFGNHADPERPELAAFFNMAQELNSLFVAEALDKSNAWFKKKFSSVDVIEALYTSLIKYSKDKNTGEISHTYPPTFKISLPQRDGNNAFQTYTKDKEMIEFETIDMKGGELIAIIQCTGIWVAGGKFGCTWRAAQLKVFPNSKKLPAFAFKSDPEEDYESFVSGAALAMEG